MMSMMSQELSQKRDAAAASKEGPNMTSKSATPAALQLADRGHVRVPKVWRRFTGEDAANTGGGKKKIRRGSGALRLPLKAIRGLIMRVWQQVIGLEELHSGDRRSRRRWGSERTPSSETRMSVYVGEKRASNP